MTGYNKNKGSSKKNTGSSKGKGKKISFGKLAVILCAEAAVLALVILGIFASRYDKDNKKENNNNHEIAENSNNVNETDAGSDSVHDSSTGEKTDNQNGQQETSQSDEQRRQEELEKAEKEKQEELEKAEKEKQAAVLKEAELLFMQYDYDKAAELLKSYEGYENIEEFIQLIADIEEEKASCVRFGAYSSSAEVSHIFFHSLIADNSKAFDGDYTSNGYNYYMTTISEFKEMMRQLYEQGYVLVSIHDIVKLVENEDGTYSYKEADLMLPPDKKPFVLSQDDVNYYDYMDGDGFASRMVIDENGRPSTEMLMDDGTTVTGDFDIVPVLETFISEHPDFSYRGARGLIALTGYEGTLGYRTDPDSKNSPTYEQDKETVKHIAEVMREYGWEFACHSNGHRDMYKCTDDFLVYDTDQWLQNVGSLVGETDVYIFPYGIDIENTIKGYTSAKFDALYERGFKFYCGVYKDPWIQIRSGYIRMTRRPLDGQAMLMYPERLADLFDLSTVIDPDRPELK